MKKRIFLCAATTLLLSGCGGESAKSISASDIYGTWRQQMSDCTETITFKADMTYDKTISYTSGYEMDTERHDNWSLSGDTISIHYTDYGQVSDYRVTIEGNTMTWTIDDSQIVYTKVS